MTYRIKFKPVSTIYNILHVLHNISFSYFNFYNDSYVHDITVTTGKLALTPGGHAL